MMARGARSLDNSRKEVEMLEITLVLLALVAFDFFAASVRRTRKP